MTAPAIPRRTTAPLIPPQHGAWGFLVLPLVLGIAAAGWSPWLVPLAVTWVAAYPASWAITGLLTARRPGRFRKTALAWTPICLLAGVPVLATHLWLSWFLAVYLLLFGLTVLHARARRERSLANDLILITECTLLVPVVAGIVARPGPPLAAMTAAPVLVATLLACLTLVGTTLHVKSLIRERRNPAYTRASRILALAAPIAVVATSAILGTSWWLVLPFVLLAARAFWLHRPHWRPADIGMLELAGLLSVAGTAFLLR